MKYKIICAFICVIAVITAGCSCAQGQSEESITGTWVTKSPVFSSSESTSKSDSSYYYTFEQDGKVSVTTGTFSFIGNWSYVDENGKKTDTFKNKLKIDIQTMISGTFTAKIKEKSEGSYTLTLTDDKKQTMTFKSAELPKTENKKSNDFKETDYITGKWQSADNEDIVYTFNSDGTCELIQTNLKIDGTYVVKEKDKVIEVTYLEQTQNTWNIPFLVKDSEKGKKITFANSVFEKVG